MGKVVIRKNDGYPIEYQSGDCDSATMLNNYINAGGDVASVDVVEISDSDYKELHRQKIDIPRQEIINSGRIAAKARIMAKLNINDSDLDDLRSIL